MIIEGKRERAVVSDLGCMTEATVGTAKRGRKSGNRKTVGSNGGRRRKCRRRVDERTAGETPPASTCTGPLGPSGLQAQLLADDAAERKNILASDPTRHGQQRCFSQMNKRLCPSICPRFLFTRRNTLFGSPERESRRLFPSFYRKRRISPRGKERKNPWNFSPQSRSNGTEKEVCCHADFHKACRSPNSGYIMSSGVGEKDATVKEPVFANVIWQRRSDEDRCPFCESLIAYSAC